MSKALHTWLDGLDEIPGVLGCGLRLPDRSSAARSWSDTCPKETVEKVLRHGLDVMEVLRARRLPAGRLRWLFTEALVYCEQRRDGACLCLISTHDPWLGEGEAVTLLIGEFRGAA
jgi:hypothetical protein